MHTPICDRLGTEDMVGEDVEVAERFARQLDGC